MFYRATAFSLSNQAINYAGKYNSNIFNYQKLISSGVRLHRPSEDPIEFRQATSLAAQLQEAQAAEGSIRASEAKLNASVTQLTDASNLLVRAKTLAQQGIQSLSPAERNALAIEVEGLMNSLKQVVNSKTAGSFLFSGTKSNTKPFEFSAPTVEGATLSVNYLGSNDPSRSFISESVSIDSLYAGNEVFSRNQHGETVIRGKTGAAAGTGTDNMIGRATLQVRHTSTTYLGGSGVATGISSAEHDTVLGQVGIHRLTIVDTAGDGSAGTVSLNNGVEYSFTDSDTDLEVFGPNGEVVYIDTTNITAGFSGQVDLTGDGTLSVDGGYTTTTIDFSNQQAITDAFSKRFANIDSSGIQMAGNSYLEFTGTSNAVQLMYELTEDLRNTRGLDNADYAAALDQRVADLEKLTDHILDQVGQQSASLQTLDRLNDRNLSLQLETESQLSEIKSTDIPETVLRMENDRSLLEYTYAVTAQITATGLIDFLR